MFVPIAPFCLRKGSSPDCAREKWPWRIAGPSLGLHMRGLFRREKSKQASFELSCRKLTVTVSAVRLHELDNRFRHLAELRYRRCSSSAMSMVTSRDQPSAALKAIMRTGLLYRVEAKGRPQYAFRGQNLFALKRPLSPGVAILKQGRLRGAFTFKRSSKIFVGVLSRSLFVDQANSAAPLSVNLT